MNSNAAEIVSIARSWIGTPYAHQASVRGVGCDCLGLLRGVWRELHGEDAETPPPYSPDWAEASGEETLYAAMKRHLTEIDPRAIAPGDIALFRMTPRGPAKHCGIVGNKTTSPQGGGEILTLIHARQNKQVSEEVFGAAWRKKLAYAFRIQVMAALVLGIAGEALGASLFGAGISIFGATLSGAAIGGAIGAFAGSEIDAAIAPGVSRKGPQLSDVNIQSSTEGAPIQRVFGRIRVAGQLLWATQFLQTAKTTKTNVGGKGIGTTVKETDYTYSISFAVGLCEGVVAGIGRVWANGNLLDMSQYTTRFYPGDETQSEDPLIQEIEGSGNTPAYRGTCYIVFEDMPLADFGFLTGNLTPVDAINLAVPAILAMTIRNGIASTAQTGNAP